MQTAAIDQRSYRGRFAPTPSGPLHLGSLLTALASWLQARSKKGAWLLRIDDLDTPRNVAGAADQIQRQLESHGLVWDEEIRWQSQHLAEYEAALERLHAGGLLYACTCTRAQLKADGIAGPDDTVYAGTCRGSLAAPGEKQALRLRVPAATLCFDDGGQGRVCRDLALQVGDFVVRRNDGLIAYQLACAVDEPAQRITEVMRGADLLGSSFRQLAVQQALGLPAAHYHHLPVLTDAAGLKLSKQNHALAIEARHASRNIFRCLSLLGQDPPPAMDGAAPAELLAWAVVRWNVDTLPKRAVLHLE